MKHFKTISSIFVIIIVIIFVGNVYYMIKLYGSIRSTVEKDVMTAIEDADLDELWIRLENQESTAMMKAEEDRKTGEMSSGINNKGTMKTETKVNGEVVDSSTYKYKPERYQSYNNIFSQTIARQLHYVIDKYASSNLHVMDSVLRERLSSRYIFPEYVAVEVIDSVGNIMVKNPKLPKDNLDEFSFCFNSVSAQFYKVHITPLTRHILSQMMGVIITIFLLMVAFAVAFWYLLHTVSKLKTIEEMKDDFTN